MKDNTEEEKTIFRNICYEDFYMKVFHIVIFLDTLSFSYGSMDSSNTGFELLLE